MNSNILIIKLGALGDLVLATPIIQRIQAAHPAADIWLLTTPPFTGLFTDWPGLKVEAIPRKSLLRMIVWVRRQGFQRIYDLQSNDRTGLVCALSGVAERIGEKPRFPYTHHPPHNLRGRAHAFERHNAVLASAGIAAAEPRPWLPVTAAMRHRLASWLAEHGLADRRLVLCHAGASARWASKRWPYFEDLASRLAECGYQVVWLGASEDAAINAQLAERIGLDATGTFAIPELMELGRHAAFAVTNDSAPMHVLAGSGIPVYGLFGPTNWRLSHAVGQGQRALHADAACPACITGYKNQADGHTCLSSLSVDTVMQRLRADGLV